MDTTAVLGKSLSVFLMQALQDVPTLRAWRCVMSSAPSQPTTHTPQWRLGLSASA